MVLIAGTLRKFTAVVPPAPPPPPDPPLLFEELFAGTTQAAYTARGWYDGTSYITAGAGDGYKFLTDATLGRNVLYAHWATTTPSFGDANLPAVGMRLPLTTTSLGATAYVLFKTHNVMGAQYGIHWTRFGRGWGTFTNGNSPGQIDLDIVALTPSDTMRDPATNTAFSQALTFRTTKLYIGTVAYAYGGPTMGGIFTDDTWYELVYYVKPSSGDGTSDGALQVIFRQYGATPWTTICAGTNIITAFGSGTINQFLIGPYGGVNAGGTRWTNDIRAYFGTIRLFQGDAITSGAALPLPPPSPPPPPPPAQSSVWLNPAEIAALPTSGSAWNNVLSAANTAYSAPVLSNQDDPVNVRILAAALVYARIGGSTYLDKVLQAIDVVNATTYNGRALALGRELGAYVIAADLIGLSALDPARDATFRTKIYNLLRTFCSGGPASIIECQESRPNNWGMHATGCRATVDAYLGDTTDLARCAQVFKGWMGDRTSYTGFGFSTPMSWHCNPSLPVGINPVGCTISGNNVDGVLPDDQRRSGGFVWPPPKENYVYEALQGALMGAYVLFRRGYDTFNWQSQALRRAYEWLHTTDAFDVGGDDTWQTHLVNFIYGTSYPAPIPSSPGKNMGWTDWTHA